VKNTKHKKNRTHKIITTSFIALIALCCVMLPNCAKYSPTQTPYPAGEKQEKKDIHMQSRKLSQSECEACFDSKKLAKQYDAIQIYVKNKSTTPVLLSSGNIGLPLTSSQTVCKKIYRNTLGRVAAYSTAGLVLWPFFISAYVDGNKSRKANRQINHDVALKVFGVNDLETIYPNESINKIIFVKRSELQNKKNFSVKFVKKDASDYVTFDYKL